VPETIQAEARRRALSFDGWPGPDGQRNLADLLRALADRDLERLGELARLSALRMHAVMLASRPPFSYWVPDTLAVMTACAELRREGIGAWETMDAGPQVKVLCLEADLPRVEARLRAAAPGLELLVARPGPGVERL